ncbi:MAG: hypothetical protein METHAR1v1_1780005 [Methanothrix sp.]|nr:MAG: hypothetical protein METHAR1v1_1780005 [Methanothrix sp.]
MCYIKFCRFFIAKDLIIERRTTDRSSEEIASERNRTILNGNLETMVDYYNTDQSVCGHPALKGRVCFGPHSAVFWFFRSIRVLVCQIP